MKNYVYKLENLLNYPTHDGHTAFVHENVTAIFITQVISFF